jgi:hypothetical protein
VRVHRQRAAELDAPAFDERATFAATAKARLFELLAPPRT